MEKNGVQMCKKSRQMRKKGIKRGNGHVRVLQWLLVNLVLADEGQSIDSGSTLPAGSQKGEHTH